MRRRVDDWHHCGRSGRRHAADLHLRRRLCARGKDKGCAAQLCFVPCSALRSRKPSHLSRRPVAMAPRKKGKKKDKGKSKVGGASASASKKAKGSAGALPADWEELSDDDTGATYYYNARTEEACAHAPNTQRRFACALRPPIGLPRFCQRLQPAHGSRSRMPQVSWERPVAKKIKKTPPPAPMSAPSCVAVPKALTYEIRGNTPRGAAETPLPNGWTEYHDDSGTPFYVNDATSETQWDRPRPLLVGTL